MIAGRPTLENWMAPPGNRWAFRHVRELLPTARVRRGDALELPEAIAPGLATLPFRDDAGGEHRLEPFLAESFGDACVVLHRGAVVYEWYAPGGASTDRHLLFSVTKSVVGVLAGAVASVGLVDLEAPIVRYVPEVAGGAYGDATVRHLLDMTTAIDFVEDYSPGPDVRAYRESTGWYPSEQPSPGMHAYLAAMRRGDREHGERFRYLSPNTDVAGWVLERATGLPLAEALQRYLWAPLGAEHDGDLTLDRFGAPRAAGGLSTTARDLARFGLLVAEGGRGVVPAAFIEELRFGGDRAQWADGDYATFLPGGGYRSFWYQPNVAGDPGVTCAVGIHGQLLYVDAARSVVVVKQSSWPGPSGDPADRLALAAARAAARFLDV